MNEGTPVVGRREGAICVVVGFAADLFASASGSLSLLQLTSMRRDRHAAREVTMPPAPPSDPLPFPQSLCHRCGAPPKYVRTKTSVFVFCPLLPIKYPPQPVLRCPAFVPK